MCMHDFMIQGFKFAGAQNGDSCFCGNICGSQGKADESHCDKDCKEGDKKCGGYYRNSIYFTGRTYY